tara:strand:+ start:8929 stop:9147 length:219 start_codon:yes stop_codon:yes gene_type:complete
MKDIGTYWKDTQNRIYKIVNYKQELNWRYKSVRNIELVLIEYGGNFKMWCYVTTLSNDRPITEDEYLLETIR